MGMHCFRYLCRDERLSFDADVMNTALLPRMGEHRSRITGEYMVKRGMKQGQTNVDLHFARLSNIHSPYSPPCRHSDWKSASTHSLPLLRESRYLWCRITCCAVARDADCRAGPYLREGDRFEVCGSLLAGE